MVDVTLILVTFVGNLKWTVTVGYVYFVFCKLTMFSAAFCQRLLKNLDVI